MPTNTIAAKSEELLSVERYLEVENCFRVVLANPMGQQQRVNYVEAVDIDDARSCFGASRVVSARPAVVSDAGEMLRLG